MKHLLIAVLLMLGAYGTAQAEPYKPFHFCGGAEGGFYDKAAKQIVSDLKGKTSLVTEAVETGGSVENATLLKEGDCAAAIIQADVVTSRSLPSTIKVTDSHVEAIYWLYPATGVKSFSDMTDKKNFSRYKIASVAGSGAEATLQSFANTDKDYQPIDIVKFDDWIDAAEAAANGYTMRSGVRIEIAGMLYVGRPGFISSGITERFSKQLTIGEINDSSLTAAKDANGNPLYYTCELTDKQRNGLAVSTWGKPDTLCMKAQVVLDQAYFADMDRKEARKVSRIVNDAIADAVRAVR